MDYTSHIGQRFGRLTVLAIDRQIRWGKSRPFFVCRCDCGNESRVWAHSVLRGDTSSCGCLYKEIWVDLGVHHGESRDGQRTPEYRAWMGMITRCTNPREKNWKNYGGRGIKVCDKWLRSYPAFLSHVGRRPSLKHSLDRYPNNDGNYEPGNVRWATQKEQANNRRNSKRHRPVIDKTVELA